MAKTKTFKKTFEMLKSNIGLNNAMSTLLENEGYHTPVGLLCESYKDRIKNGENEEFLYESFVRELEKLGGAGRNFGYTLTVSRLNEAVKNHKNDIAIMQVIQTMVAGADAYVVPMIESAVVNYMTDKNAETRAAARETLALFENNTNVKKILETLSFEEYEEKTGKTLRNSSLNEAALPKEKTYTEAEVKQILEEERVRINEEKEAKAKKDISMYDTHINLHGAIKNILKKEAKNEGLRAFCETYMRALNEGKAEEILYESFISGLSRWNHLNAVDTQLAALGDRINKYKQEINLKKILETMKSTSSYFIVPLIEDLVVDYMENKTMQNRAILKQRLEAFEYDPFVRDILEALMYDQDINATAYLGESLKGLEKYVHTEKIFSPVQYIKENESIFNVKGNYYTRKGNSVTKMTRNAVATLDESFKRLCALVNHSAIKIDDLTNTITIFEGMDKAVIGEFDIEINSDKISTSELNNLVEMAAAIGDQKIGFYTAIKLLNENFNNIAPIDFCKRISLNESNTRSVDVFKLKKNLFITTIDEAMGTTTFYRNVNPMQCRTVINEHMGINVAPMFEDVLPEQEEISQEIEDTKAQYETCIDEYNKQKAELESMLKNVDENTRSQIEEALKLLDEEIESIKSDFKTYQANADGFTSAKGREDGPEAIGREAGEDEADMSEPISQEAGDDMSLENIPEVSDFETMASEGPRVDDFDDILDAAPTTVASNTEAYNVVKVSYAENVKTGRKSNKGEVFVLIPSVDSNGDVHDEVKKISFYLDADHTPVINNDYMPVALYNAIRSAIEATPETAEIDTTDSEGGATEAPREYGDMDFDAEAGTDNLPDINDDELDDIFGDKPEGPDSAVDGMIETPIDDTDPDMDDDELDKLFNDDETSEDDYTNLENRMSDDMEPMSKSDDDLLDLDDIDDDEDDDDDDEDKIEPVKRESPAETRRSDESAHYPINCAIAYEDLGSLRECDFKEALDEMKIAYEEMTSETGDMYPALTVCIGCRSDAKALRRYFKEEMNYDSEKFNRFFPELKCCFNGVNESAKSHKRGRKMNEAFIPSNDPYIKQIEELYDKEAMRLGYNGINDYIAENGYEYNGEAVEYSRVIVSDDPENDCNDNETPVRVAIFRDFNINMPLLKYIARFLSATYPKYRGLTGSLLEIGDADYDSFAPIIITHIEPSANINGFWDGDGVADSPEDEYYEILDKLSQIGRELFFEENPREIAFLKERKRMLERKRDELFIKLRKRKYNPDDDRDIFETKKEVLADLYKKNKKTPFVIYTAEKKSDFPTGKYEIVKKSSSEAAAEKVLNKLREDEKKNGGKKKFWLVNLSLVNESQEDLIAVPYNGFLMSKLAAAGYQVLEEGEKIYIEVSDEGRAKLCKIFEGFYGSAKPTAVKMFMADALNEGVEITIKDDESGKTIKFNTENPEEFTTFDTDKSMRGGDGEEDEEKDKKKDKEDKENDSEESDDAIDNGEEQNESNTTPVVEKKVNEGTKKKKFIIKKRGIRESIGARKPNLNNILNEEARLAKPNVLDFVEFNNGTRGQIIASLANGNFIVHASGHTFEVAPSAVKMINQRLDTVDCPYKFNKETLAGIFEQMVEAAVVTHGVRVTPTNTYVKYSDWLNAKNNEDVRVLIEGQNTFAKRSDIEILADINEFANVNDYRMGNIINENGEAVSDIIINARDFMKGTGYSSPVRCLIESEIDGTKKTRLISVPKGSLNIK